jgi:hypothetical protein
MPRSASASQLKQVAKANQLPFHYSLAAFMPRELLQWGRAYWKNRIGRCHPFQTWKKSNGIVKMQNAASRIAVAGDWGTGTDEAFEVAERMKAFAPHYTVHLGDIYYVGDACETNENFLGVQDPSGKYEACRWPSGSEGQFALSGNHEMYARGIAYFDMVLPAMKQEASYFCIENDYWRVIGLDTAYNSVSIPGIENVWSPDCSLREEQLQWLEDVVRPGKDSRGIVLMTHHQYYSAFEENYPRAAQQLSEFIARPVLWFWGHEHRFAVYDQYALRGGITAWGRCIGHGGMPIEIDSPVKHAEVPLTLRDNRAYPNDEDIHIGYNGYVELTFGGSALLVNYMDLAGHCVLTEKWVVDGGKLAQL